MYEWLQIDNYKETLKSPTEEIIRIRIIIMLYCQALKLFTIPNKHNQLSL